MLKIAIAGLACAGKTTVYNNLATIYEKNTSLIKFAKPHYDVLSILGVPKNRLFMQDFSDLAKKHFGEDIFVKAYDNYVNEYEIDNNIDVLICDDLRYQIEFDYCKMNDWYLIYVESDENLRKERSDKLGLKWNPKHNSEQCHLFYHKCDLLLKNNGTVEEFKSVIDKIHPFIIGDRIEKEMM